MMSTISVKKVVRTLMNPIQHRPYAKIHFSVQFKVTSNICLLIS
jgi:hypothetical protein